MRIGMPLIASLALLSGFFTAAQAQTYYHPLPMCRDVLTAERGATISRLSDREIENGICMTSREAVQAIGRGDVLTQNACTAATAAMMKEFSRRFPGRDSEYTLNRC